MPLELSSFLLLPPEFFKLEELIRLEELDRFEERAPLEELETEREEEDILRTESFPPRLEEEENPVIVAIFWFRRTVFEDRRSSGHFISFVLLE